jgi:hypothetical protein
MNAMMSLLAQAAPQAPKIDPILYEVLKEVGAFHVHRLAVSGPSFIRFRRTKLGGRVSFPRDPFCLELGRASGSTKGPTTGEISEWADDPFINNYVEPWLTPTAPQYGCSGLLETGDPVVAIGFAMGTNTYDQGPNPDGTQSADVSEPTQSPSRNIGRYTLMGDLNPFPGFRVPATGCN